MIFKIQVLLFIMCHQNNNFLCVANSNDESTTLSDVNRKGEIGTNTDICSMDITSTTKKKPRTYKKRKTTCTSIRNTKTRKGNTKTRESLEIDTVAFDPTHNLTEGLSPAMERFPLEMNTSPPVTNTLVPQTETFPPGTESSRLQTETLPPLKESLPTKLQKSLPTDLQESLPTDLQESLPTESLAPQTFLKVLSSRGNTNNCTEKLTFAKSVFYLHTKFPRAMKNNKSTHRNEKSSKHSTEKRPLDRRRQVVMGGRVEKYYQSTTKRISVKQYTPLIPQNTQRVKFTPKYSPIILQSLFQQVIDLRKAQTSPKMIKTTTNKYEAHLAKMKEEYDYLLSEERAYNESRIRAQKKEDLEIQLREASMQKSYLYKFIVTKVTTESWEKDLPASSRALDEEYMDHYRGRINKEPIMRKHYFVRKCRARKQIELAEQKLESYRNASRNKLNIESNEVKKEECDDASSKSLQSSDVKDRRRPFEKRKNYGKPDDQDEFGDSGSGRHHARNQVSTTPKKSTYHFYVNEQCKMMQEGWARRTIRKSTKEVEKRKEDNMDIYEPDPESNDEQERMKSYDITSNQQFIQYLKDHKFAQDERVLEAIHWVDRDRFAKDGYVDSPHNFGTNSIVERPSYQAFCLDHLADKLVPGANVLDLGFGSGFMSCCMARMVGDAGHVTAVDHIPHLVNLLLAKLKISFPKLYKLYKIMDVVDWDARKPYKKNGPYDVIHFGGGVKHIPLEFIPDLKINGSILVPVGPAYGPHILKKITLIKRNVYTIQNLAEVEALHFCGPEDQIQDFRQTYGHHFIKLFSLFYKTVQPYNSTVVGHSQTYKLPDT